MKKIYELDEGKYRLERCHETYILWAYRHGEPWAAKTDSLVGDKLVHALLDKIDQLEAKLGEPYEALSELRKQLIDAENLYKVADSSLDSSPLQVIIAKEELKIARYNYALACRDYVEETVFAEDGA